MIFIKELYEKYLLDMSVSVTVHQKIQKGLFFAIRRKDFNGNPLAIKALENGASYAIVDDPKYYIPGGNYILVENSLTTLKQLAHHHRLQYTIPVIAITGSYGKTTNLSSGLDLL
jgi:UDP-N-acetylmuramoyl-tripeptide--D-alanyl-D-alanine ligase